MSTIYSVDKIREWDAFTIKSEPLSSIDLMERAAIGCLKQIIGSYAFNSVAIVCGKGNNGGDGLAIARLLADRNITVTVFICEYSQKSSDDFEQNLNEPDPTRRNAQM